jgi:hypothetical protein
MKQAIINGGLFFFTAALVLNNYLTEGFHWRYT